MESEKDKTASSRLTALDGIRGLAILLVFFNHINSGPIIQAVPESLKFIFSGLFSSGVTGVSLLFILSGFLMAYIYPDPDNKTAFLQKRYTRIFPLFLSMATVMMIFRLMPELAWYMRLGIIAIVPIIGHLIWVYGVKKIASYTFSRMLFFGFVLLQLATVVWYGFWLMKHPAVYLNQLLPTAIRESSIYLTNATLTLPLGDYIPMLDGVYWSLGSEVLFYILYPLLAVPLVIFVRGKSRIVQLLIFFSLIPFFMGVHLLSNRIFASQMLQFPLFFYFATGIALGYIYKQKRSWLEMITAKLNPYLSGLLFIISIALVHVTVNVAPDAIVPWVRILWAIPLTLLIGMSLIPNNLLARISSHRVLTYLGTISYSIYLSHTAIIDTAKKIYTPTSALTNILFIVIVLLVVIAVATYLYKLLELPYFMKTADTKKVGNHGWNPMKMRKAVLLITALTGLYFIAIFFGYQSNFNLTSMEHPVSREVITTPQISENQKTISLHKSPQVIMQIPARENNLGIITMNLNYSFLDLPEDLSLKGKQQELIFKVKEAGAIDWYATSTYKPVEIGISPQHPFGFPLIIDSKGKTYEIELSLADTRLSESIDINIADSTARTVHQLDKSQLLKDPKQLVALAQNRLTNVINHKEAQYTFLLFLPLLGLLVIGSLKKSK
ncbi:MAG: acyltransferase family protein [Weeksellaceae bacterium]